MISKDERNTKRCSKVRKIIPFLILKLTLCETNNTSFLDIQINILIWTKSDYPPFTYMIMDRMQKCSFKNCFVTNNNLFFTDERDFDVLLFNLMELHKNIPLPQKRLERQKYIFVSREPPALYTPSFQFNGYFNLTWTYKSISDITLRYVIVKDKKGKVIGPDENIQWMDINDMKPVSKKIKRKLQSKYLPVAWLVSNCFTPSRRETFVQGLQYELAKYQLNIDIFGQCGDKTCSEKDEECHAMLEADYYFFLAFENSFAEEYVSEKLLVATKHLIVPIVYGGADYTRLVEFTSLFYYYLVFAFKNLSVVINFVSSS